MLKDLKVGPYSGFEQVTMIEAMRQHWASVLSVVVVIVMALFWSWSLKNEVKQRKRSEKKLLKSEERFRKYFELGLIGMAITSLEKGWLEFNDTLHNMFGVCSWASWLGRYFLSGGGFLLQFPSNGCQSSGGDHQRAIITIWDVGETLRLEAVDHTVNGSSPDVLR
jgi:hypothetical protein